MRFTDRNSTRSGKAHIFKGVWKKMLITEKQRLKSFFIFIVPAFLLYTFFIIVSIAQSFYYSLTDWNAIAYPVFRGLKNYIRFFNDADFKIVFNNTLLQLVIILFTQIPLGMIIAYFIFRTKRAFRIYRFLVFLPVILSASAVALLFTLLLNTDFGPVNTILSSLGLENLRQIWLSDPKIVFYSVLSPMVYQSIGINVIIMLAGMQTLPEVIFESALIDGSNSVKTFINIVIPMLRDIIMTCVILMTSNVFKSFEHSYVMTWGGPGVRSSFLGVYMYMESFRKYNFGKGSAIAIVILIVSMFFIMIFNRVRKHDIDI